MYNIQTQQSSYQQPYLANRPIYQTMQPQPFLGLKGRPVASVEEVRGSIIDFDGSIFYFPDIANNRIYTKQINMDGASTVLMYELKEFPKEQMTSQYITREEFEAVIAQLKGEQQAPAAKPKEEFKF